MVAAPEPRQPPAYQPPGSGYMNPWATAPAPRDEGGTPPAPAWPDVSDPGAAYWGPADPSDMEQGYEYGAPPAPTYGQGYDYPPAGDPYGAPQGGYAPYRYAQPPSGYGPAGYGPRQGWWGAPYR